MDAELKKIIALLQAAGYDVYPKDQSFNLTQLRIAFNAARVPKDIHYPINPDCLLYKDADDYLKSINVPCTPDSK